ncbi:MAG: biotin--[acetyl-CoA-carboxylase] ligase [Alphaproteobacteria bacterium]|nr:biotin--[acetyl-CoA-carboxylase] ligase [Alphaproteobacteria bacterium]
MTRSKKTYHLINDYHLLAYECVDSTNEEAKRLAEGGAAHGAVIWAKEQTAGKGRLQRQWESKRGNLYVSLLLAPNCALAKASQLSFVAAVAAVEALQPLLPNGGDFQCKWPNDILLGNSKLGGILLESFKTTHEETGKVKQWVVAGIGINIDSYPKDTLYPATCLKEAGVELVSAKIVLTRFVEHFMTNYDCWVREGFEPIREKWLQNAYGIGEAVEIASAGEVLSGTFKGMSASGEMLLTTKAGQEVTINSGDVFFNPLKAISTKK